MPGSVDGAFVGCAGGGVVVGRRAATAASWDGGPGFDAVAESSLSVYMVKDWRGVLVSLVSSACIQSDRD